MPSDSRQFVARTDSSSSARLMLSFFSSSLSIWVGPAVVNSGNSVVSTSGPGSLYCTKAFKCLRRILADSTTAICGAMVPLVQISMTKRS